MRFILAVVVVVVGMRASLCPLFAPIHTKRRFYFLKSFLIVCQMGQCEADRRHLIRAQPRSLSSPSPYLSTLALRCPVEARVKRSPNDCDCYAWHLIAL